MKAVIYARQSSGDDDFSDSIDAQIQHCQELASKNNLDVIGTFSDLNCSGKTYPATSNALQLAAIDNIYQDWQKSITRPEKARFRQGLAEVIKNLSKVDYIILDDSTRLMRPLAGTYLESHIKQIIVQSHIKILTVKSGEIDYSTFSGSFLSSIEGQINDNQIAIQRKKSKDALQKLKDNGYFASGQRRYGYIRIASHQYAIVPEEAKIIRYIFDQIITLRSYMSICKDVNARFHPEKIFNSVTIKNLPQNWYLCGKQYNSEGELIDCLETKGKEIIDFDTFVEAQKIVSFKRKAVPRDKVNFNIFAGIVKCGYCGKQMVLTGCSKGNPIFRCKTGWVSDQVNCNVAAIAYASNTDQYIGLYEFIQPILFTCALVELERKFKLLEQKKELEQYKTELLNIQKKEDDISLLFAEDKIDAEQLGKILSANKARKSELRRIIENAASSNIDDAEIEEYQNQIINGCIGDILSYRLSPKICRRLILDSIDKICVYRDYIEIYPKQSNVIKVNRFRKNLLYNALPKCTISIQDIASDNPNFEITGKSKVILHLYQESYYNGDTTESSVYGVDKLNIIQVGKQFEDIRGRSCQESYAQLLAAKKEQGLSWSALEEKYKLGIRDFAMRYGYIRSKKRRKIKRDRELK